MRRVVAADEAVEDFGEIAPLRLAEPPHDAEIDGDDVAGRIDEEIALVHVGVEEAVAQRLAQERLHQPPGDERQVVAGGLQRLRVGELDALDPVEGQHVARRQVPFHRRHAEALVAGGELGHLGERGGLEAEVHLDLHRARQRIDHRHRPEPPRSRVDALDQPRRRIEGVEVVAESAADAGPQHLDRDGAAARLPRVASSALWTWAIEAAAIGGEKDWKSASTGLPSAAAIAGAGFRFGKRRDLVAQLAQRLARPPGR